tara:strand:+ start:603 stop:1010 length:408 start_codon:yes stop_codon:yes gene_type:complete
MAFKIERFYGSPLRSSSPDRPFTSKDTERKEDKFMKTSDQIDNLSDGKKKDRKMKKLVKTMDQLDRNASGDKTPLRMEDAKLMAMKKRAAKLKQEIAAMRAESKKTGKVTNWDDKSDQLSRLNEQIAAYKPKKSE